MRIYISGIMGTGMGPLALMAKDAGLDVCGSDLAKGAIFDELMDAGIELSIGEQDGEFLKKVMKKGVDWFVYTSALPEDHAELKLARQAGIRCTKRDELTAYLVEKLGLKMIAVAGTHGKTTTTAMIIYIATRLGLPVAYIVGSTLKFAPSARYRTGDKYFVYEADEYDRNFLKFHPWLAVIPSISYDHGDIYATEADYREAFSQFMGQSGEVLMDGVRGSEIRLAGAARRHDAGLAVEAVMKILAQEGAYDFAEKKVVEVVNEFPGVGRRFERIADGVYTDYAHHPEEIEATVDVALDECRMTGKKGVIVVYQPHQNIRQHEVRDGYKEAFLGAEKIFWLPTYLVREDPELTVLTPEELIQGLVNREKAEAVKMDDGLAERLKGYIEGGYLVVLMTAGPADGWLREWFGD